MDTVEVSTVVFLPPEEVYEFLLDFPRYGRYSEHLKEVRQFGDGTPGTEYELDFAWWKITYTTRSRVTDVAEPERIDWRIVKDVDAVGSWHVEKLDVPDPDDADPDDPNRGSEDSPDGESPDGDVDDPLQDRLEVSPPAFYEPGDPVTRVTMHVQYAPDSAGERMVDLPRFVSLDWVVEMVKPMIQSEAEKVVRRIVADLEGDEREVALTIETS